jgi:hypothetical protein
MSALFDLPGQEPDFLTLVSSAPSTTMVAMSR